MEPLYRVRDIRQIEQYVIAEQGIAEMMLMQSAGTAGFNLIKRLYTNLNHVSVLCGRGNNGGDGFVIAKQLHQHGYSVTAYCAKPINELKGVAYHAAVDAEAIGVKCQALDSFCGSDTDLIVDALLGIGLKGAVRGAMVNTIHLINAANKPVVAIDCPSGLDADTGRAEGVCVQATHTITFIARKLGLYLADAPGFVGQVYCDDIGLNWQNLSIIESAQIMSEPVLPFSAKRSRNTHKGMFGHVLIVSGGKGMPGAAVMSAEAALRAGAGLATIATCPDYAIHTVARLPEAMIYPVNDGNELDNLLKHASVCVIGPGLGEDARASALMQQAIQYDMPMVVDASALALLSTIQVKKDHWVLTPHPGEAAKLLGSTTKAVQDDRVRACTALQAKYGGTVVLKGAGTLIYSGYGTPILCPFGNPGMSSAGMGDVLTGVIAGLLAQNMPLLQSAQSAVCIHALAGDRAVSASGERGLMATDLMPHIRYYVNCES